MVHQWYIMNPSKTPKLLILKSSASYLVWVRVPLSAHNISDLALKTWYIMVHYGPNGTLNGTLSITPHPRPGLSSGIAQVVKMYETIFPTLLHAHSTHSILSCNFHQSQCIRSTD